MSLISGMSSPRVSLRLLAVAALLGLAACDAPQLEEAQEAPREMTVPGYEAVDDGEFMIPAVPAQYLPEVNRRQMVSYSGPGSTGNVIVDPHAKFLYLITAPGEAMRYRIAVGREGRGFRGSATINRRAAWPAWTPTANMIRTEPETYAEFRAGLPGGLNNPLGARALYLYRNGRDTMYRIHGTNDVASIGQETSAGCIRLFNQDIIDLHDRVGNGTRVRVLTVAESARLQAQQMVDLADDEIALAEVN